MEGLPVLWVLVTVLGMIAVFVYCKRPYYACCPHGSLPAVPPPDERLLAGKMLTLSDGRQCYMTGPATDAKAVVIACHDVYGLTSGRTREVCDELARRLEGVLVLLPDFFNDSWPKHKPLAGTWTVARYMITRLSMRWNAVEPVFRDDILPLARRAMKPDGAGGNDDENARGRIALVGFCWGGWCNMRACAAFPDAFSAVVGFHPSPTLCYAHGNAMSPFFSKSRCPLLYCAASNDSPFVKEGGLVQRTLASECDELVSSQSRFRTFSRMRHGWVSRGDVQDTAVAEDVRIALDLADSFLREHLFVS